MWGWGGKGRTNPGPLFVQDQPSPYYPLALSSGPRPRASSRRPVPPFSVGPRPLALAGGCHEGAPGLPAGVTVAPARWSHSPSLGRRGLTSHGPGVALPTRGRLAARSADGLPGLGPVSCPGSPGPSPRAAGGPSSRAMVEIPPRRVPGGRARGRDAREARAAGVVLSLGAAAAPPPPGLGPRTPASCPAVGGSPLRRAGWAGMAAGSRRCGGRPGPGALILRRCSTRCSAGRCPAGRTATGTTARFHCAAGRAAAAEHDAPGGRAGPGRAAAGPASPASAARASAARLFRALSLPRQLVQDENVRGVITMNEEYETRFLCNFLQGEARAPAPRPPPSTTCLGEPGGGSGGGCAVGDLAADTSVPGLFFFSVFFCL